MSPQAHRQVTIIMYHFVRDLKHSRYPDIKGLSIEDFSGQVAYIRRYYTVIGLDELLAVLDAPDRALPPRALLLTFDDGYRDHFDNVLPILVENGMTGCFFPPAKAVTEQEVLDVNKIHFILAAVPDKTHVLNSLFALLDQVRGEFNLSTRDEYYQRLAWPNRFDTAEVILIKRLLQRELPELLRKRITDELFKQYVTQDERSFSQELYMDISELRAMWEAGMYIGSHGYDHYWLDTLDEQSQEREIDLSLRFLQAVGSDIGNWVIGYPYGAYNDSLLGILRKKGCKAGFTTEVHIADLDRDDPLTLPRIDTNDLPKRGDAAPNEWTMRVLEGDITA
jgi:peptidoglycan/xylan/chitin deacetylase (PgdA/CDA1 family)